MAGLEIHPLSELRGQAARLLAERYADQQLSEPLLPNVDDFHAHVPDEPGLVATRGSEAVAYLAGRVDDGAVARIGFAGCAASEPETLRDLFAALAVQWDVSRFAVAVPAHDRALLDVWFRLAFGCQFYWAVREVEAFPPVEFGGQVRLGTTDDHEAAAAFDGDLIRLQMGPPSFSGMTMPTREELLEEWRDTWDDERFVHFVAERDGRVVGQVLLYRRPEGDLRVPPQNIDLAHAEVLADERGTGVGLALTAHAFNWALAHGFRSMTADWRAVNLLSSRFFPRRGFRAQYIRMYRAVP